MIKNSKCPRLTLAYSFFSPFITMHLQCVFLTYKSSGTIPTRIGNLNRLAYFDISDNSYSGTIPEKLVSPIYMNAYIFQTFTAHGNRLSGTIPSTIGLLTNLLVFDVGQNQLNGTIPSELGDLKQLGYLDASYNSLMGTLPHSLGQLLLAKYFLVNNNKLNGHIPKSLSALTLLREFFVSSNLFSGRFETLFNGSFPSSLLKLALYDNGTYVRTYRALIPYATNIHRIAQY